MAIILKEYLGLSLEEVAQVMECPLSTAKSRLYTASAMSSAGSCAWEPA